MTDAERVLQLFLHDLRTPIGVAQGYLRMLQDGRLSEAADTERAIAKALHALGQTARLCQDAGAFLETPDGHSRPGFVSAATFARQVETEARNKGVEVLAGRIPANARLALVGQVAPIGEAVVQVVSTAGTKRVSIEADNAELRFLAVEEPGTSTAGTVPFNEWTR